MTVEEARAFVEQALSNPGEIDRDLLIEAIRVLHKALEGESLINPKGETLRTVEALRTAIDLTPPLPQADPDAPIDEGSGFQFAPLPEAPLEAGPRPIGVPFDFVASKEVRVGLGATREGDPTRIQTFEPQYFEGDELAPQSLDPAAIIHLQKRLVAAGLMDEGDYYAGYWTEVSEAAYKKVLGVANTNGTTATVALSELIRTLPQSVKDQRARAKQLEKFQAPPYIEPDYATLAQDVKTTMRTRLRRDPTAAEMLELTRTMGGFDRQDFDAFTDAQRFAFNRAQGIQPPVLSIGGPPATPVGTPTFQDVDPVARFRELFERRYKPEIDRLVSLDEVRRNTTNVFASLRTMSSLVGGPRR